MRSASYTWRRRGTRVSRFGLKTVVRVSRFGLKTVVRVFRFGLKTGGFGLVVWASKPLRRFLGLSLKTMWRRLVGLRLKTDGRMKTVRGHASTSCGFLRREGSHARVSQFGLKTVEERRRIVPRIVHVAPSRSFLRGEGKEMDGSMASAAVQRKLDKTTLT